MPTAIIDDISTRFEVLGSRTANSNVRARRLRCDGRKMVGARRLRKDQAPRPSAETLHLYSLRPARMRTVRWPDRTTDLDALCAQGRGLLDHLGINRAHIMGACMGCAPVAAFGRSTRRSPEPNAVLAGRRGKIPDPSQQRFAKHLTYVQQHGLAAVVELAQKEGKPFGDDPRGGPWASVIKRDTAFAEPTRSKT